MAKLEGTRFADTLDAGAIVCLSDCSDSDWIYGYGGDDAIYGRVGSDYLFGGAGDDVLYGGQGNDSLWGDEDGWEEWVVGNDYLEGGPGGDDLHGGGGVDTAGYIGSSAGVSVSLTTGRGFGGDAEGDTLYDIENLTGSDHDDFLAGNDAGNGILGRRGDDIIKGFGGADALIGGDGNDWIDGGAGWDWLEGNDQNDTLRGGSGEDTLIGGSGNDDLWGGADRDWLQGGAGADGFHWSSTSETGASAATADRVVDYNPLEGDWFDLSGIDADTLAAGNQAFRFIMGGFSGTPGEVRYYWSGGNTYIQMNTDADADAEGVIRLDGLYALEAGWFLL